MKIRHEHSYFGPPPLHCPCCGKAERTSGCVRGFTCQCDWQWCKKCFKCSKHCQCAQKQPEKQFECVFNDDGTCGARWDCFNPGVVLAYDDFSPESATWFCGDCWEDLGIAQPMFTIVEDKR